MNGIKVWPHMTIVAVIVALVAGLGVAFWMKYERSAAAQALPYAARIQRVDGEVALSNGLVENDAVNPQWVAATANQPFSVGDRIYTRDNARTSLAFSGRNFARLNPNTSLDVVSLGDRRTQLALRDGSAMFDLGYLAPNELFEVATPYGAVDFDQPGLYNVGFDNNGGVLVSVLSGLAQVVGMGGSGRVGKGEILSLIGQAASQVVLSRLNGGDAGYLVDDYYRYQYPNYYDGRYSNYDAYLNDPYYYDPYQRDLSYQYASSLIPGLNDLDYYGDWQNVSGYGNAWSPRVDPGWMPYQEGYWTNDYPYGPTWVSNEPWGYAPYHYGRWANAGNRWYWIPDAVNTTPAYAPALVAFVPLDDSSQIGWVPLGPGENYAPRYYDDNWQPRYLTRANVVPAQLVNLGVPGAVTVVPVDRFDRDVDWRSLRRIDQQRLAAARSTLDPLTLTPLRNAVVHSAWGRGKIDLPPGIAKKLRDTRVFVGEDVPDSRFRKGLARSLRVERVSDDMKRQQFKVRDERRGDEVRNESRQDGRRDGGQGADAARALRDTERRQQIDRLSAEAARGDRDARRQVHQLERQQRNDSREQSRNQAQAFRAQEQMRRAQENAQRRAEQQAQGERVGNPARGERGNAERRQQQRAEISRPQMQPRYEQQRQVQQQRYEQQQRQQIQQQRQVQRQEQQPQVQHEQRQQVQRQEQRQQVREQRQPVQVIQMNKHEARQQSQEAPRQERRQDSPAQPSGDGHGGGGGKGKGKGKP